MQSKQKISKEILLKFFLWGSYILERRLIKALHIVRRHQTGRIEDNGEVWSVLYVPLPLLLILQLFPRMISMSTWLLRVEARREIYRRK